MLIVCENLRHLWLAVFFYGDTEVVEMSDLLEVMQQWDPNSCLMTPSLNSSAFWSLWGFNVETKINQYLLSSD